MTTIVETPYLDAESAWTVIPYLSEILRRNNNPVFVCVGTPKVIGDSLGPLVGSIISGEIPGLPLYGTLANPVHALNLEAVLRETQTLYPHATLIGIDSSLSTQARVGYICLHHGKLQPGRAVHGCLPSFGDYKLYGNIGDSEADSQRILQHILKVSAKQVQDMATVMATIVVESWHIAHPSSRFATSIRSSSAPSLYTSPVGVPRTTVPV